MGGKGGMGQENAEVNRDANDADDAADGANGANGASGPPGVPRDGGTLNMGASDEAAEPQDATPWYAASADAPADGGPEASAPPPVPAMPPLPPMPPQPPPPPRPPQFSEAAEADEAEPADAVGPAEGPGESEESPEPAPPGLPPEPGTVFLAAREPRDAPPPSDAEPQDVPPAAAEIRPETLDMGRQEPRDVPPPSDAEPQDVPPAAAEIRPETLDMGRQEPQDAPPPPPSDAEPSPGGTVHLGTAGASGASGASEASGEGPEPVRWRPLPAEPGTVRLSAREPQDAPTPPPGTPWAGAPADDDDEDASLGGDAPLVGTPPAAGDGQDAEAAQDDEDASLGGDAPLVGLPDSGPVEPQPEAGAAESGGDAAPGPPADETGRLLAGRYRLADAVGRGGMGTVWRAHDEMLGRVVAVKELRLPGGVDDHERTRMITRTLREAKAIASIRNQGVVTVFDVVDEGSRPWIVMELIEGRSLADIIRNDGPMPPPRVAEIGLAVLDVLRAAHGAGILHRDVKPSNVLVAAEDGRVVLTDFGIAKVEGDPSITSTGMLVGAPSYISPERARGEVLGPPADMWSLGALLYCCVEGMPPYDEGSAIATLAAVMHDPVPPPRQAGALTEVITGLLDKEPANRLTEARTRELLLAALEPPTPPPFAGPAASAEEEPPAAPLPAGDSSTMVMGARPAAPGPTPYAAPAPVSQPSPPPASGPATPPTPPPPVGLPAQGGGHPAGPAGPGGGSSRRRTLIIVGVAVVLLALVGAALATTLGGDSEGGSPEESQSEGQDGGASDGSGEPTPEETTDPTQDETDEPTQEPTEEPTDDGGPPGTVPSNDPDATLPEDPGGMSEHVDEGLRFSMSLPSGWEETGAGTYAAPDGSASEVAVTFDSSPADSALSAWQALEPAVSDDGSDYEFLSASPVAWRGYPTVADWEFERTEDGERVHVLTRLFRVDDDQGYSIGVSCAADEWDGETCESLRDTVFDTFQPLD
ncbi:protein kinase domain-containing protein [Streptomyces sp. 6N223]|uniref:protein kinase domain-containing protein n=1 Tax=Streptomyces sp. 6N223 TaxID=3457412 RepID=UPI003FD5C4A1